MRQSYAPRHRLRHGVQQGHRGGNPASIAKGFYVNGRYWVLVSRGDRLGRWTGSEAIESNVRESSSDNSKRSNFVRETFNLVTAFGLLVGMMTVLVFLPTLGGEFLNWDDDRNFLANEAYRGLSADQWSWAWTTYHLGVWQPLAWLLFGAEYLVGKLNPRDYHEFSIVIHGINAALLFFLIINVENLCRGRTSPAGGAPGGSRPASPIIAATIALLFALHPLRVEAVAWISCQPYLPCATCWLWALIIHTREYAPHRRSAIADRVVKPGAWIGTFAFFVAAVLFKAPAVTLPLILLLLDFSPLDRIRRGTPGAARRTAILFAEKVPHFVIAFFVAKFAMHAKDFNESRMPFADGSIAERLAQSVYGSAFYLVKTVAPFDLSPYYALPDELSLMRWPFIAAAALVLAITILSLALIRRAPGLAVAWLAYLVILAPSVGLVQISRQIAADRYAYIATIPLFVLSGVAMMLWHQNRSRSRSALMKTAGVAALAALVALTLVTQSTIAYWGDSVSLWKRSIEVNPGCAHSHCQLGQALAVKSEEPGARRSKLLEDAARHLRRAVEIQPDFAFALSNLGAVLLKQRRFAEAEEVYLRAVALKHLFLNEELARVYAGLALTAANLDKSDEGWEYLFEAKKLGLSKEQQQIIAEAL